MPSNEGFAYNAWINPFVFHEADKAWEDVIKKQPTQDDVIRFICNPDIKCDLESLVAIYREISKEPKQLIAAPYEPKIMAKIIWPLRHAKADYMLGNYLGTISLCGIVAEMLAVLLHEISTFTLNGKQIEDTDKAKLFGKKFERLGQERRVQILRALGFIDPKTEDEFNFIRNKRNKYLHYYTLDQKDLPNDAIEAYNKTVLLVVFVIGQDIVNGKIKLRPELLKYLIQHGVAKENRESPTKESA